jgi:hypothetical protein
MTLKEFEKAKREKAWVVYTFQSGGDALYNASTLLWGPNLSIALIGLLEQCRLATAQDMLDLGPRR